MNTRKIYALCKKLGLSTTYLQDWGHGFYDEVEADPSELEERIIRVLRDKQLLWYEKELSRLSAKQHLHIAPDIFQHSGLLLCDGGTKENTWEGVTYYIRVDPIPALWDMYNREVDNGPRMPDLKQFEKHCKQLARQHWRNKDSYPVERLVAAS